MNKVSLCIIARNEEKNIEACLDSVRDIIDEVIIVDTGSTDKTKGIANDFCKKIAAKRGKSFGFKILDFKWAHDFSAARNESIRHATKDWILVLDADETLDNAKEIKDIIKDSEHDALLFLQKNYTNDSSIAGFVAEKHERNKETYAGWFGSFIARLFRNKKGYEFKGVVHELIEPSIEEKRGKIAATNIAINHYGNSDPSAAMRKRNLYLELCKGKVNKSPTASSYYELGVLQKENNDFPNAIKSLSKAIELNARHSMAFYELGVIYGKQNDLDNAIKNYTESLKIKEDCEALMGLGVCCMKKGMLKEAYRNLTKAMLINPNKYSIYNNLGAVLEKLGNYESAAQMLEIATKLNPSNKIGFYNLGVVLDKKGDFEKALSAYSKAAELNHEKKSQIEKRIRQINAIIASNPNLSYNFKVGG